MRGIIKLAALVMLGGLLARADATEQRPNFLLLFTDDQRFDTIHALGCREILTPHMDALAKDGVSFTHAAIMGSMQGAVCIPSRAMLMTGRGLARLQKDGAVIPSDHVMMSEWLHQNGYRTFITGKWHQDKASLRRGFQQGEAIFVGGMGDHFNMPVCDLADGQLVNNRVETRFDAEVLADAAIKFLQTQKTGTPFFAYVSFRTPHDPRVGPKHFHDIYDASKLPLPPNFQPEHPFDIGIRNLRDELLAPYPRTPEEIRQHIAAYYALTTATDAQMGRILAALRQSGLADNTIVIFAGDNGLAVGQHGLMGKQSLYDHSIRVPLIITGPGLPKDKRTDAFCYLLDIFPTVCAMAGLRPPSSCTDGRNLLPLLKGQQENVRETLFFAYSHLMRALRTRDWKLIEYDINTQTHTQLFHLTNDPWETNNLATDPQHANILQKLQTELASWAKDNIPVERPGKEGT